MATYTRHIADGTAPASVLSRGYDFLSELTIQTTTSNLLIATDKQGFEYRLAGNNLGFDVTQNPDGSFKFTPLGTVTAIYITGAGGTPVYESIEGLANIPFVEPSAPTASAIAAMVFGAADTFKGSDKDDTFYAVGGNDTFDGAAGQDTVIFSGLKADYTIAQNANGSFTVTDNIVSRDGTDTLVSIEKLQFSDQTAPIEGGGTSFPALFAANISQSKAISAAYQVLLGGTPGIAGFDFLIKGNLATNFGAGSGPVFNDENIFINVANALVQGNATATATFNTLASGNTLAEKVASLYAKIIPAAKQTAEGLAFLTRPEGLKFYQDVAKERGITAENGPAVTALASLLKVAVDSKIGIGNPVSDLIASIADGSSELPATSTVVLPIETIDGTKFDADDAPDAMPGFSLSPPTPIIGTVPETAVSVFGIAEL